MKLSNPLIALIIALITVMAMAGCASQKPVDPQKTIKQAQGYVKDAQKTKSTTERDDHYKKAVQAYTQVVGQYATRPEGAQAMYELARVYETAEGPTKNLQSAYNEYSTLIIKFDKPRDNLLTQMSGSEANQVLSLVKDAKTNKYKVSEELDKINSKKTLYKIMDFFVRITGKIPAFSYWFAILLVTLIVKLIITPLTKAQFKAMKEMQKVAPFVKEIQEKYKGDQKTIGEKTMELYKDHNINPFASCLPILIQMPILWLLYYMIRDYQFQFAKATYIWIGSGLSHWQSVTIPFGTAGTAWVTARNLSEPDLILVVLYLISMYISTKMNAVDPTQAEQQKTMAIIMPLMFALIFIGFT